MPTIDYAQFRRSKSTEGAPLNEWLTVNSDDVEVLVRGDDSGPEAEALAIANIVLDSIEDSKTKAIRLLESFMRDKGTWFLNTIDVSIASEKQGCDFILEFGFEAENDPHVYGYSFFSVCFLVQNQSLPANSRLHPFKFIVEFR